MRYAETGFELEIDLARGAIDRIETNPADTALYLGGAGAAARIFSQRVAPTVGAFDPDNILIFSTGLLTATPVPGANRTAISSIDPLSNLFTTSEFEGFFGAELKYAGFDRLILSGRSETPVYLFIRNGEVELRDATHLMGKSSQDTARIIREELNNPKIQVAAIGPAGENRSPLATVDHSSASAPMGVGAVMGAKNLKAVAVRGTRDVLVKRSMELMGLATPLYQSIYDNPSCGDFFLDPGDSELFTKLYGDNPHLTGFWSSEFDERMSVTVESEHVFQQWENYSQEFEEVREMVTDTTRRLRSTGCYNCPKYCHEMIHMPGGGKYFLKSFRKLAAALAADDRLEIDYGLLALIQDCGLDESGVIEAYSRLLDANPPDFPEEPKARLAYLIRLLASGGSAAEAALKSFEETDQLDSALGVCPLLSSLRRDAGFTAPYDAETLARVASLASGLDLTAEELLRLGEKNRRLIEEINAARRVAAGAGTEVGG